MVYRSYEAVTRPEMIEAALGGAALGTAGLIVGGDVHRVAVTFAVTAVAVGLFTGWRLWDDLTDRLSGVEIGPLPPGERALEDLAREWGAFPRALVLRVVLIAAIAAGVHFFEDTAGHLLLLTGGVTAGHALGLAIVLAWLRRRRRRDGMELHCRSVEGGKPEDLLLVPRGS